MRHREGQVLWHADTPPPFTHATRWRRIGMLQLKVVHFCDFRVVYKTRSTLLALIVSPERGGSHARLKKPQKLRPFSSHGQPDYAHIYPQQTAEASTRWLGERVGTLSTDWACTYGHQLPYSWSLGLLHRIYECSDDLEIISLEENQLILLEQDIFFFPPRHSASKEVNFGCVDSCIPHTL